MSAAIERESQLGGDEIFETLTPPMGDRARGRARGISVGKDGITEAGDGLREKYTTDSACSCLQLQFQAYCASVHDFRRMIILVEWYSALFQTMTDMEGAHRPVTVKS